MYWTKLLATAVASLRRSQLIPEKEYAISSQKNTTFPAAAAAAPFFMCSSPWPRQERNDLPRFVVTRRVLVTY